MATDSAANALLVAGAVVAYLATAAVPLLHAHYEYTGIIAKRVAQAYGVALASCMAAGVVGRDWSDAAPLCILHTATGAALYACITGGHRYTLAAASLFGIAMSTIATALTIALKDVQLQRDLKQCVDMDEDGTVRIDGFRDLFLNPTLLFSVCTLDTLGDWAYELARLGSLVTVALCGYAAVLVYSSHKRG